MRILHIHKSFKKNTTDGSLSALLETKKLLEKKGHTVIIFSTKDKKNLKTEYAKYFPKNFNYNEIKSFFKKIYYLPKVFYNLEAKKNLETLIKKEKPQIAHLHSLHFYLSPSIIDVLKKYNIPIIHKLPTYQLFCPNYRFFTQGKICEKCKGGKFYHCALNKCLKNSFKVSLVAVLEAYFSGIFKFYQKVDLFLAPSLFMQKKAIEHGLAPNKVKLLRNVFNFDQIKPDYQNKNYFLYYGLIAEEKGIESLILAVNRLKKARKLGQNKLKIAGNGPKKQEYQKIVKNLGLKEEIKFVPNLAKGSTEWKNLIKEAKFVTIPSIWYENSPNTATEAMAFGKPVIVSNCGGSPEMIENHKSGFIFEAGNSKALAQKIDQLLKDPKKIKQMGQAVRKRAETINNEERYYEKLISFYKALANR
ncbi:MAG: glycosyltransferase [Candidatus Moranbacteria bacterium]|nr:glycosyltransferase [Candidatus Moranbacteria bacterium]